MYQALYRKWRPRSFEDVVGQEHITEILRNQVRTDSVSHAYLFIGTRGTGKTTCAKILAKAVNCESPVDGSPCNKCRACRGIDDGTILDVEELDAASNNSVDNVRALRDEAVYSPASVKKRVYIIDEVHMLSVSAFNALLKILEEPPEHLMFILATTELHKLPATILSRCQRFSFKRLSPETVAKRLLYVAEQESLSLTEGAAALLGRLAEGSMRDGLSMLDQCAGRGTIDEETVRGAMGLAGGARTIELLDAVAAGETGRALALFDALWRDGKDPATLLGELCALERDALLVAVAPKGGSELASGAYDVEELKHYQQTLGKARLLSDIEKIQETLGGLRSVQSPRTAAELCLISMCEPVVGGSVNELRARIERLEQGLVTVPHVEPGAPAAPVSEEKPKPKQERKPEAVPASIPVPEPASVLPEPEPEPASEQQEAASEYQETPVSVPEPAAVTASAEPKKQSGDDVSLWPKILEEVQSALPIGVFNMLSDSAAVSTVLREDTLTVQFKNGFAKLMIDKPDVLDKIRAASAAAAGHTLVVRTEEVKAAAPTAEQADKLKGLESFGVTFE